MVFDWPSVIDEDNLIFGAYTIGLIAKLLASSPGLFAAPTGRGAPDSCAERDSDGSEDNRHEFGPPCDEVPDASRYGPSASETERPVAGGWPKLFGNESLLTDA